MARLADELQSDFSRGMFDSAASTAMPRSAVNLLLNGRVMPDGTISTRSGTRRKHKEALLGGLEGLTADDDSLSVDSMAETADIIPEAGPEGQIGYGGIYLTQPDGTEQLVVICGAKAFVSYTNGLTFTEIADDLPLGYWEFATMRTGPSMYLYAVNGSESIYTWDGSVWGTLENAPEGVKYIATFNSRLVVAGHAGPIVQASAILDPTTWASPDGWLIQTQTHDGDEPTGLFQIGERLLIFQQRSTSYLSGYGEATLLVANGATGFSRSVGCVAHRTIAAVGDNAVCWLSDRGIERYSTGDGIQLISGNIDKFFRDIARGTIEQNPSVPSAAYDPIRQEYHLALPTSGVRNNRIVVINPSTRSAAVDQTIDPQGGYSLGVDEDGYLTVSPSGAYQIVESGNGYLTLGPTEADGYTVRVDGEGYLATVTTDSHAATLFMAPCSEQTFAVHSVGYDGYVRNHGVGTKDNLDSRGLKGAAYEMTVVSRPFYLGQPRRRKRVRNVHLSTIGGGTLTVRVRANGDASQTQSVSVAGRSFDQTGRAKLFVSARGDAPQVEVRTTDQTRIALIGVSAEVMDE
jgi:hypothetical protein